MYMKGKKKNKQDEHLSEKRTSATFAAIPRLPLKMRTVWYIRWKCGCAARTVHVKAAKATLMTSWKMSAFGKSAAVSPWSTK